MSKEVGGLATRTALGPVPEGGGDVSSSAASAKPSADDSTALLTADDVAALLRVPLKSVYHLVEMREIPCVRIGRRVRFVHADVVNWIAKHRVPALEEQ